ncbi:MAG: FecR domain-containing protein [Planctomycetota bacterium]
MATQFTDALFRMIDGTASEEEVRSLQRAMEADRSLRAEYLRVVALSEELAELASAQDSKGNTVLPASLVQSVAETKPAAPPTTSNTFRVGVIALAVVASVALIVMLIPSAMPVALRSGDEVGRQSATSKVAIPLQSTTVVPDQPGDYVASIIGVTEDLVWGENNSQPEFLLRCSRDTCIDIRSGLVELEYATSARLILRGPCEFVVTGQRSGQLNAGTLTGIVDQDDFQLTTPSAVVVDLGTRFGVRLNQQNETDVHVFDGEVRVKSSKTSLPASPAVSLTRGMSARVRPGGTIQRLVDSDASQFTTVMPPAATSRSSAVSLVDLCNATSDQRTRLATAISVATGLLDNQAWQRPDGPGHFVSHGYRATQWHPFVDGVFVPPGDGGLTVVDTENHQIDLPASTGRTWGPIWIRRKVERLESLPIKDFWGTLTLQPLLDRLRHSDIGMIGIHSNAGLTIDLDAVRQAGMVADEFVTIVSNAENKNLKVKDDPSGFLTKRRFSVDFSVLIDGVLRDEIRDLKREDGHQTVRCSINESDRFLTLLSTDHDQFDGFDHLVLIDPVLQLAEPVDLPVF